jgi:hypothetical protein
MRSFSTSQRMWLVVASLAVASTTAILGAAAAETAAAAAFSWTIYHSWDGGNEYTRRGVLEYKKGNGEEEAGFVITNDEAALTKDQVAAMLDFGWYHVKIDTNTGNGDDFVLATIPACNLRRANFKDEFSITLPRVAESDLQITSLAYTPLVSPLAPTSCDDYTAEQLVPTHTVLSSKVQATMDTPGMTLRTVLPKLKPPPGYAWLAHANAHKGSVGGATLGGDPVGGGIPGAGPGGEGEEESQKPFFIKYWYVVLPLALANFLPLGKGDAAASSDAAGEGEEGGGGPIGAAAAAGAGGAAVPAAAVAGKSKRAARRGKRG